MYVFAVFIPSPVPEEGVVLELRDASKIKGGTTRALGEPLGKGADPWEVSKPMGMSTSGSSGENVDVDGGMDSFPEIGQRKGQGRKNGLGGDERIVQVGKMSLLSRKLSFDFSFMFDFLLHSLARESHPTSQICNGSIRFVSNIHGSIRFDAFFAGIDELTNPTEYAFPCHRYPKAMFDPMQRSATCKSTTVHTTQRQFRAFDPSLTDAARITVAEIL
ncbi:hypothetical protein EDB85DRAFT_1891982 [Lactarius pseudohatsudake]|nr:hypothetical protein EDB85DRAFT_1891982 [Lactarius pseudohatsudake]